MTKLEVLQQLELLKEDVAELSKKNKSNLPEILERIEAVKEMITTDLISRNYNYRPIKPCYAAKIVETTHRRGTYL